MGIGERFAAGGAGVGRSRGRGWSSWGRLAGVVGAAVVALWAGGARGDTSFTLGPSIVTPNPAGNDQFGNAVSVSGDLALVGAQTDATGGAGSGQAYVFDTRTGALLHTLADPGMAPTANDNFGVNVSLSVNLALVGAQNDDTGATNAGAAYLFDATSGALLRSFVNPHPAVSENFGHDVAVFGNRALVSAIGNDTGAVNAGVAYLFDTTTGALLRTFTNPAPGPTASDFFGQAVALNGNRALISTVNDDTAALNAGAAYLFDTTTGALLHTFLNPTPELNNVFGNNDNFGFDVALSSTKALIGAPNEGVNGFHNGAAYLYDLAGGGLLDTLVIPTPNKDTEEFLGNSVALSDEYAVAGAPFRNLGPALAQKDQGAAFVFDVNTGAFLQELNHQTPGSGDGFGGAVAVDGDRGVIGGQVEFTGSVGVGRVFAFEAAPVAPAAPLPGAGAGALLGMVGVGAWRWGVRGRRRGLRVMGG